MNREIKLRIRLRKIDTGKIITKIYTLYDVIGANELRGNIGYEILSVEQFTGLHDKNGKEIYEGDIFKGSWYNCKTIEVKWLDSAAGFNTPFRMKDYEVIGNIHETPELLEAAK